jgi:hypothetical protein
MKHYKRETIHKGMHIIKCPNCGSILASASERGLLPLWGDCNCLNEKDDDKR